MMLKSILLSIVVWFSVSGVTTAQIQNISTAEETNTTDFFEKLVAARQFVEAVLPLLHQLSEDALKRDYGDVDKNKVYQALKAMETNLQENPILITTLAKYFSITELEAFTKFLVQEEAFSVLTTISQQIFSQNRQFKRDFSRVQKELESILSNTTEMLE